MVSDRSDQEGLFGPESVTWRVDREMALFAGGPRAILLKLAHPSVAAGVEAHSDFRNDPLGRMQRTMNTMFTVVFGSRTAALAAAERVARRHALVQGEHDGKRYRALDPDLLLWVHATLVDTSMRVFSSVVRPLAADEADKYYEESKIVAELFGVPRANVPPTLRAFKD
jgi:uncharacterized protein (DUF2236 family)